MPFAFVVSVSAGSTTNDNVTTAGVDTTNATLLVAAVASGAGTRTLSDSKTNTWTALTRIVGAAANANPDVQLYYVTGPTVGAAHTFTVTSTGLFPAVAVAAYSGSVATIALDVQNGQPFAINSLDASPQSVTPVNSNSIVVSGIAFGTATGADAAAGMTIRENFNATANAYGVDIAEVIQTTPTTINPKWTWTTTSGGTVAQAVFNLVQGTTSDDYMPRADFTTNKRNFLNVWYKTANADISRLQQRWNNDANLTSPGGAQAGITAAGTANDATRAATLLEFATQGKTS